MRIGWILVLAFIAFALTLVLHMPAGIAYAWLQKEPGAVRLHGVDGTLRRGTFTALTVNGREVLRDARWTLHPAWLPLLRLSAELETGGDAVVRARVSRAVFGALKVSDLAAEGRVKALLGILGQGFTPVEGRVQLDVPVVRLDGGVPVEAHGSAQFNDLTWTLAQPALPLGSFGAVVESDAQGVRVRLDSGPGPLEVGGSITLAPTRAYDVHLRLRPRPEASAQLVTLLRSLGAPDAQGWHHVRRNGTL